MSIKHLTTVHANWRASVPLLWVHWKILENKDDSNCSKRYLPK